MTGIVGVVLTLMTGIVGVVLTFMAGIVGVVLTLMTGIVGVVLTFMCYRISRCQQPVFCLSFQLSVHKIFILTEQ